MMKRKTLFFIAFCAFILGGGIAVVKHLPKGGADYEVSGLTTKYGAYLAAQHAIYTNDFKTAKTFTQEFADIEYDGVKVTRMLAEFLGGNIPQDAQKLVKEKNTALKFIYDAYLAQNNDWDTLYKRHSTNKSALDAPFRIWSGIATRHYKETLKYIDSMEAGAAWKAFVRGQIYAEQGDIKSATKEFAAVPIDFMNINDYMYLYSFYTANSLTDQANELQKKFTSSIGGMFMSDFANFPDFAIYKGIKNALAFSLIQNVSHTQIILYSDLSVLMLRFAQIIGPDTQLFQDTCNYYIGQFFANTRGNYQKQFDLISPESPLYLFAEMRRAGDSGSIDALEKILKKQPLFVPALNKLVALHIANGNKTAALTVLRRALKNKKLTDTGRAYLIKRRALVNMLFGNLNDAQADIRDAVKLSGINAEVLMIQARIWAAQWREIENAYDYAMNMIKNDPMDVLAWDTLAVVVSVREGNDAALDILERVGASASTCSSLFEHLGDAYIIAGKNDLARTAYMRAIELSDDGFVIVPNIQKKLKKIK